MKDSATSPSKIAGKPILIYQMGRVGLRSIVKPLQQADLPRSVHHLQLLAHGQIQAARELSDRNETESQQLDESLSIRAYLDSQPAARVDVITGVRDPVAQMASSIFHSIVNERPDLIDGNGYRQENEIFRAVQLQLDQYVSGDSWNCHWFDTEFQPALGVDVFAYPFHQQRGYASIVSGAKQILVLRCEDSVTWPRRITNFLELTKTPAVKACADATPLQFGTAYQSLIGRLEISPNVLKRIYSTQFCRHFYSPHSIAQFSRRWSKSHRIAA